MVGGAIRRQCFGELSLILLRHPILAAKAIYHSRLPLLGLKLAGLVLLAIVSIPVCVILYAIGMTLCANAAALEGAIGDRQWRHKRAAARTKHKSGTWRERRRTTSASQDRCGPSLFRGA